MSISAQRGRWGGSIVDVVETVSAAVPGDERVGVLAGAGAYAIWGLFPLYFHLLGDVGPFEVAWIRILATSAFVWLVLAVTGQARAVRRAIVGSAHLARIAAAGLMITTNWVVYVWAVANDHVVDAAIGYFVNPLVTVALGVVLLREGLRAPQRLALVFGAASVVVLTVAHGRFPWVALTLAVSFALYGYLKKTAGLGALAALAVETLCVAPLGIAGLAVLAARGGLDVVDAPLSTQALVITLGAVTAGPLVLFGVAARRVPLSTIGLLQYLSPVLQLLCGVLVLGEAVSTARWVGMACVWVALAVLVRDTAQQLRGPAASPSPAG